MAKFSDFWKDFNKFDDLTNVGDAWKTCNLCGGSVIPNETEMKEHIEKIHPSQFKDKWEEYFKGKGDDYRSAIDNPSHREYDDKMDEHKKKPKPLATNKTNDTPGEIAQGQYDHKRPYQEQMGTEKAYDMQRVAYSHRHNHNFVASMGDLDEEGQPISFCSDEYCTAIRYANGTIMYNNDPMAKAQDNMDEEIMVDMKELEREWDKAEQKEDDAEMDRVRSEIDHMRDSLTPAGQRHWDKSFGSTKKSIDATDRTFWFGEMDEWRERGDRNVYEFPAIIQALGFGGISKQDARQLFQEWSTSRNKSQGFSKPGPGTHSAAWDKCVADVKAKGTGNAYAICTAQLGDKSFKSFGELWKEKAIGGKGSGNAVTSPHWERFANLYRLYHGTNEGLDAPYIRNLSDKELLRSIDSFIAMGRSSDARFGNGTAKMNTASAGPVPNSLLARQDMAGEERTTKAEKKEPDWRDFERMHQQAADLLGSYEDEAQIVQMLVKKFPHMDVAEIRATVSHEAAEQEKERSYRNEDTDARDGLKMQKAAPSYGILHLMQQHAEAYRGPSIDDLIMEMQRRFPMVDEGDIVSVAEQEGERRGFSDYSQRWKGAVEQTGKQLDAIAAKAEDAETEKQKMALVDKIKAVQIKRQAAIINSREKSSSAQSFNSFWRNQNGIN